MWLLSAASPGPLVHFPARRAGLPRFYLDTSDGDFDVRDMAGHEACGREEARLLALAALKDMAGNSLQGADRRDFVCNVRDDTGRPIFTATLSLIARWLD
ncbi:DUF6894 family protein [Roseomonas sp. WA12]